MGNKNRYVMLIEDEWRLQRVARLRLSVWRLIAVVVISMLVAVGLAVMIIMYTPLRNYLPGYIPETERAGVEDASLRVDSIKRAYEINEAYIKNLQEVMDTERPRRDSVSEGGLQSAPGDTLMKAGAKERAFISAYNKREKYNVSMIASLAADNMIFMPVSGAGVISTIGDDEKVKVILKRGEPVMAIADGTVVETVRMCKEGGASCVIQHGNGFVSRYSHLSNLRVAEGDKVQAGGLISLQREGGNTDPGYVLLQLWRHGEVLKPAEILR